MIMKRAFALLSVVVFPLFCLQLAIPSSALAAKKKVIIGYSTKPGKKDEDKIRAKNGKIKHRYSIIAAIAAEVDEAELDDIRKDPNIEYVEPDHVVHIDATYPDDPKFSDLWGLHNTGQAGGTAGADIAAPEAWDTQTGSSDVVIAVIDTGVDYTHEDLNGNMWVNENEGIGDLNGDGYPGVAELDDDGDGLTDEDSEGRQPGEPGYTNDLEDDDDENGYVDDIYGYDFCGYNGKLRDSDPMDDHGHGSHVSGTIAAVGNNDTGVVGVCWEASIMALKFIHSSGDGDTSDAIACIQYATMMKQDHDIPVIALNNSWGGGSFSQSLKNAIIAAHNAGILFVASAGNDGQDNDVTPHYPASYDVDNVIAVAATDHNDDLADEAKWASNYGDESVDLAAPGVNILSTVPFGSGYVSAGGTSMATPHVTGAVGLVKAQYPSLTHLEIKQRILDSVDSVGLEVVTGGRLNASSAATMVVLSSFTATAEDNKVNLLWCTEVEMDNVGFAIYRSDAKDGNYTRIAFVPGAQDSETSNDYQLIDKQVQPGHTYYYYLEDVDLAGKRTKSYVIRVVLPAAQVSLPVVAVPPQTKLEILPKQNSLLVNYPNPFNPATWIPYNLAEAADVNIQIYDVRGHLVRTLHLGHRPAGFYLSRDRAAYWNGRDDTGDRVGSGVYYYCLSAGNFSATRKMVVLK